MSYSSGFPLLLVSPNTDIHRKKEHECVSVPRVNTVSNKFFFVLHNLHTDLHDKKHSVAQYKGGWVWHGIFFFFFVCFLIYWLTAQWHRQYVSSQTCLPVQALLMLPPLVSLFSSTGTTQPKTIKQHINTNFHLPAIQTACRCSWSNKAAANANTGTVQLLVSDTKCY